MARAGHLTAVSEGLVEAIRAAWNIGEYSEAIRLAEAARAAPPAARFAVAELRTRSLLALTRFSEAHAAAVALSRDASGVTEHLIAQMLLGAALVRIGEAEAGDAELDAADAAAVGLGSPLRAEIAYYRAASRWGAHRLDDAEAIVEAALPASSGTIRARLLGLLGWIDQRRENFGAAIHAYTNALAALDESPTADHKGRAAILHALASLASETIDLRLGTFVRKQFETTPWSSDTRIERFHVLKYLGWLSLLEGNVERAWDERQECLALSVDTTHHAMALVLAAHVADAVGDRFSRARQMNLAGALLLRGDQVDLDVEGRMAILAFVAFAQAEERDAATDCFALFERSHARRTNVLLFEGDRRVDAYALYAQGNLAALQGRKAMAIDAIDQALALWEHLACRMRAAIAAVEARKLSGDGRYDERALELLHNAPRAWLRRAIDARAAARSPLEQLTPAERRVLAELCKGKKAREIAAEFGRSFNTVNNHTRRIFSVFDVRSRSALVAACARLGILEGDDG